MVEQRWRKLPPGEERKRTRKAANKERKRWEARKALKIRPKKRKDIDLLVCGTDKQGCTDRQRWEGEIQEYCRQKFQDEKTSEVYDEIRKDVEGQWSEMDAFEEEITISINDMHQATAKLKKNKGPGGQCELVAEVLQ